MPTPTLERVPLRFDAPVPSVTAVVYDGDPAGNRPVVVLAHGAGSRADHPVHAGICEAVAEVGYTLVAFNFVYAEAGRRSPDRLERLQSCYRDVAEWTGQRFGRPLVAGGRSMGGRMASLLAADGYPFAGLVLLNYPLVASRGGAGSAPRVAHWPQLHVPVLFVHGDRDRLFPPEVFEAHRRALAGPVTVHVIAGADHGFAVLKSSGRSRSDVYGEVAAAVDNWMPAVAVAR